MTPDEALAKLMAGNAAFVGGRLQAPNAIHERRAVVADAQNPFALILTCADSRVPAEYVFDQGVGDLFVCRVAGNILEPGTIGSVEFALMYFPSAVILIVLGHQRCGAVTGAITTARDGKNVPGSLGSIMAAIRPAVDATPKGSLSDADYVEAVVKTNAKLVARNFIEGSEIVRAAVDSGRLKVVAANYSLDSGEVTLLA